VTTTLTQGGKGFHCSSFAKISDILPGYGIFGLVAQLYRVKIITGIVKNKFKRYGLFIFINNFLYFWKDQ